jgi:hypothetical protein
LYLLRAPAAALADARMSVEAAVTDSLGVVRRLGVLVESVHAVVYFAPEPQARYAELRTSTRTQIHHPSVLTERYWP